MKTATQTQTSRAIAALKPGTIAAQAHHLGEDCAEPLYVIPRMAIRYAKAHDTRYGSKLAEDRVLGVYWLDMLKGWHGLLNGDGAVALERGITTDSKDNGVAEGLFWDAMSSAGFTETDL